MPNLSSHSCVTLIGMAGAGKTTIGTLLAKKLGWAFLDTDFLIEALYATRLEDIARAIDRECFLNIEADMICTLQASHCVIATGGSVIYRERAMRKLADMGPIVYIHAPWEILMERIAIKPERGIVCSPHQGLDDLYRERIPLYEKFADAQFNSGERSAEDCAEGIVRYMGAFSGK